jgi:hypothetical protein
MTSNWTNGKLCAVLAGILFISAFTTVFPWTVLNLLMLFGLVAAGVFGLLFGIIFGVKIGKYVSIPNFARFIKNPKEAFTAIAYVGMAACLVYVFTILIERIWTVMQGKPLDDMGTIISVGPVGVLFVLVTSLIGAVCGHFHGIRPFIFTQMSRGGNSAPRWVKEWFTLFITLILYFAFLSFVGISIYAVESSKNPKVAQQQISEMIERLETHIDALEAEKRELEVIGRK